MTNPTYGYTCPACNTFHTQEKDAYYCCKHFYKPEKVWQCNTCKKNYKATYQPEAQQCCTQKAEAKQ